ncbi:MAG: hypothetical protein J4F46_10280, partial [Dehalococcoidia bacterium]|nr:hypothetical protein [Dehalococcoidia bacterium]
MDGTSTGWKRTRRPALGRFPPTSSRVCTAGKVVLYDADGVELTSDSASLLLATAYTDHTVANSPAQTTFTPKTTDDGAI